MQMVWLVGLLGCGSSSVEDTAAGSQVDDTAETAAMVSARLTLLDTVSSAPIGGVSVSTDSESGQTDENGQVQLNVSANAPFALTADNGDLVHHYVGHSAEQDLSMIGFLASTAITNQVYGMLGLSMNNEKGIVVAAIDLTDLSPAYGAAAALDVSNDGSFVFGTTVPVSGDTLIDGGSSVVFFPNVEPGAATISVTPPDGLQCGLIDTGEDSFTVDVVAGEVTVAVFICDA